MNRTSVVRRYDRAGNFLNTIGRSGEGPEEHMYGVGSVRELGDGRVLLSHQDGILVFAESGRFLARWEARADIGLSGSDLLVDPSGVVYSFVAVPQTSTPTTCMIDRRRVLQGFRFDGTRVGLYHAPLDSTRPVARVVCQPVPFSSEFVSRWSPLGYFVTAHTATYAINIPIRNSRNPAAGSAPWSASAAVVSLRRPAPRVPVLTAERQEYRDVIERAIQRAPRTPAGWRWDGPEIPGSKAPIGNFIVSSDGRIWVRLSQTAVHNRAIPGPGQEMVRADLSRRWAEPNLFDVLDPTGTYIGQVKFPANVQSFEASGDTIWAVTKGAYDELSVTRYRVAWGTNSIQR
jgi:hypothetical protein